MICYLVADISDTKRARIYSKIRSVDVEIGDFRYTKLFFMVISFKYHHCTGRVFWSEHTALGHNDTHVLCVQ